RQHRRDAHDGSGGHCCTYAGRAVGPAGHVRVRRQTGSDGRPEAGDRRPDAGQRIGDQGRPRARGYRRDGRPAAAGAWQPDQRQVRKRSKGGVMNLAALFIKRPITTTLIMLGILVFGMMSYRLLPVSDLPTVDFPTIQVQASLPGASPETLASAVALPLEKQ